MRNGIRKRSVVISGRKTSVSVEDEFWCGLKEIAFARNIKLGILVSEIIPRDNTPIYRRPFGYSYWISIGLAGVLPRKFVAYLLHWFRGP